MMLHRRWRENVEQNVARLQRAGIVGVSGAQGEVAEITPLRTHLDDVDILPAEAWAVVRSERCTGKDICRRIGDGGDGAVPDVLVVGEEGEVGRRVQGNAGLQAGRN